MFALLLLKQEKKPFDMFIFLNYCLNRIKYQMFGKRSQFDTYVLHLL